MCYVVYNHKNLCGSSIHQLLSSGMAKTPSFDSRPFISPCLKPRTFARPNLSGILKFPASTAEFILFFFHDKNHVTPILPLRRAKFKQSPQESWRDLDSSPKGIQRLAFNEISSFSGSPGPGRIFTRVLERCQFRPLSCARIWWLFPDQIRSIGVLSSFVKQLSFILMH